MGSGDVGVVDVDDELLTLQEAADRLKVHYMTAYRWVRAGQLPAFKTGGRLRVRAHDVVEFLRQRQVDVALPTAPGRTDWPTHVDRLTRLLLEGRGNDAIDLVRRVISDGAAAGEVYIHLLTPGLHRIGDCWAAGDVGVAAEHRATQIVVAIMGALSDRFRRRGPARGTAVTLTPAGEQHGVAIAMVADFLRGSGYDVSNLGADVPLEELRLFLRGVPAELVCLSVTNPADGAQLSDVVTAAREACACAVVVGGQGVDRELVTVAGGVHVDTLPALLKGLDRGYAR
ncbi:MAG: helix-turn-helix domain-containing protein [Actinomycetota bacterium]|nr:helix-turn-helix domain-containing protein [Actinomycetota bacterium]